MFSFIRSLFKPRVVYLDRVVIQPTLDGVRGPDRRPRKTPKRDITPEMVADVIAARKRGTLPRNIAKKFGISQSLVYRILRGEPVGKGSSKQ